MRIKRYKTKERNEVLIKIARSYRLVKSIAHLLVGLLDNDRFAILDFLVFSNRRAGSGDEQERESEALVSLHTRHQNIRVLYFTKLCKKLRENRFKNTLENLLFNSQLIMGSRNTRGSRGEAEHNSNESSSNRGISEDAESDDNETDLVSVLAFLLRR